MRFFSNLFGSSSRNSILVHTAKPRYFSGEMVEGTVSFSVMETCHVDSIILKFKAFEQTRLIETRTQTVTVNGVSTTTTYTVPHNQKRVFIRRRVILHAYKTTLYPGMYVYPFKFMLDDGLPSSLSYANGSSTASIVYKVKAEVAVPGAFKPNIKHTAFLQINERLRSAIHPVMMEKDCDVTYLCCLDMGTVRCSVALDKNAYIAGEIANLTLIVDNSSSDIDLKHITFKLAHYTHLTAGSYNENYRNYTCKNQAPKIPKGETACIQFPLLLPNYLIAAANGVLVKSTYGFEITLSVPCSSDVNIKLPVTIFTPMPEAYVQVEYAPNALPSYQSCVELKPNMFQIY